MRPIPPALEAHLAGGVTTLARCWRLARKDGAVMGFTDHDRDLAFGGVTYRAGAGLDAAEAEAALGLAVGTGEIAGALIDGAIAEGDIAAGLWDDAGVEAWLVNWAAPEQRLLLDAGNLGEIRRGAHGFTAEVRGPAHRYDEERGRTYGARCDAALGDARCRADLAGKEAVGAAGAVPSALEAEAAAMAAFPDGWFDGGVLLGAGGDVIAEVRRHRGARLTLWEAPAEPLAPGGALRARPGCDKRFATCVARYANGANFRGFPHLPGNDPLLAPARAGDAGQDGGPLVP